MEALLLLLKDNPAAVQGFVAGIIGAILVNYLKSWATTEFPDYWLIIMGGTFVLVVLFMPKGIVGIPGQIRGLIARRNSIKSAREEDLAAITPS